MLAPLKHSKTFRYLFCSRCLGLCATGVSTLAIALTAQHLTAHYVSLALGVTFILKMVTYILTAPLVGRYAHRVDTKKVIVGSELIRALAVLLIFFSHSLLVILPLIVVTYMSAAAMTPTYQACLPQILTARSDYVEALVLSRTSYEVENLLSPLLATVLLWYLPSRSLFLIASMLFLLGAVVLSPISLPKKLTPEKLGYSTWAGIRLFWQDPLRRRMLLYTFIVALGGATVYVNTVHFLQNTLALQTYYTSTGFTFFGIGSATGAILLAYISRRVATTRIQAFGALSCMLLLFLASATLKSWHALFILWAGFGLACASVETLSGIIINETSAQATLPLLLANYFALSHLTWLTAYGVTALIGYLCPLTYYFFVCGSLAFLLLLAVLLWGKKS